MMQHFYVGVKAVIRRGNQVLLLKGVSRPDFWDMPGGRIDENETIEAALTRELGEELPAHRNPQIGELLHAYRLPGTIKDGLGLVLLFYAVELELEENIVLSDEHDAYEWVTIEEALARGSDGIQSAMRQIMKSPKK